MSGIEEGVGAGVEEPTNTSVEGQAATGADAPAGTGVEGAAATGAAVRAPVLDLWPFAELEKFDAEATRLYDEADTEEKEAKATATLVRFIPCDLRPVYGLPASTDAQASVELCQEIKANIYASIKAARLAWVHFTAEGERQPQAPLAAPHHR